MAKLETKRSLIDATIELLRETDTFTVSDIANRAFTNVASVNYHFQDKNNLIKIALAEIFDKLKIKILTIVQNDQNAFSEETFAEGLNVIFEFYAEYKGATRYAILNSNGSGENEIVKHILNDETILRFVLPQIQKISNCDMQSAMFKYMICVGSFMLPILVEFIPSTTPSKFSLSALKDENVKKMFFSEVMNIFKP